MSASNPNLERPNPTEPMTLAERIARLERENVRIKRAAMAALLVLIGALVTAQAATTARTGTVSAKQVGPKEVEAQRITLVDGVGRARASLEMSEGGPELRFLDTAGKERISLGLLERGPHVSLKDAAQRTRAMMDLGADGPSVVLADEGQVRQTQLWVAETEMGLKLTTGGARGIPLIDLVERPRGSARGAEFRAHELNLYDPDHKGQHRAFLQVGPTGAADFSLKNRVGNDIFREPR